MGRRGVVSQWGGDVLREVEWIPKGGVFVCVCERERERESVRGAMG